MDVNENPNSRFKTDVCEQGQNLPVNQENQNVEAQDRETVDVHVRDDNDLPIGWEIIIHASGMPVYFNKELKVCTFGKPYFLANDGSLENHEIPIASVPCLSYKSKVQAMTTGEKCPITLSHEKYREYCKKVFKFKTHTDNYFNSSSEERKFKTNNEIQKLNGANKLNENSKSIDDPQNLDTRMTATFLSFTSLLQNYLAVTFGTTPVYISEPYIFDDRGSQYAVTLIIDGMQYGRGIGQSIEIAEHNVSKTALEVMLVSVENNFRHLMNELRGSDICNEETTFDKLKITDSRIPALCTEAAKLTPDDVLQICLKRNFDSNTSVNYNMAPIKNENDSKRLYHYTMTVRGHSTTVICDNILEGRQKGVQSLLQVLHPHISYFGSLLRLYNQPNYEAKKPRGRNRAVLRRSRIAMRKWRAEEEKKRRLQAS